MTRPLRGGALYWSRLSLPSLALVLTGVFFTFASAGFILDSLQFDAHRPWSIAFTSALFSGTQAVLFALVGMRSVWFLPVAVLFELQWARFSVPMWIGPGMGAPAGSIALGDLAAIRERAMFDGLYAIICVALGYVAFILFMRTEGLRQIRLRTEMELARGIHAALVPPVALTTAAIEARGRSVPSSEVGGDLVDAFERDGRVAACVADVAGHGVPAGALMALIRGAMRSLLPTSERLDALLADVNRMLVDLGRPDRFVTLACLRFDGAGGAEYALAGHLPILRVRPGAGAVERLENTGLPLGVQSGAAFTAGRTDARAGDLFAIITDGLSEVPDRSRQEFGIERVEGLLLQHAGRTLEEIEHELFAAAERHGRRLDDQTLLLVRVR